MRYFFDLDGDEGVTVDTEGVEYATFQQMRSAAMGLLAEVMAEVTHDCDLARLSVRVRDTENRPVYDAVLTLEGHARATDI